MIRTNVDSETIGADEVVSSYKSLSTVERAFRSYKSVDLKVRPIHHRLAGRVRVHVFLCMLAYYLEWHMRQAWAPILFDDEDREQANSQRRSVVAPAQRSASANRKARRKRNDNDEPVHSFQTLLTDLATIYKDRIKPNPPDDAPLFDKILQEGKINRREVRHCTPPPAAIRVELLEGSSQQPIIMLASIKPGVGSTVFYFEKGSQKVKR